MSISTFHPILALCLGLPLLSTGSAAEWYKTHVEGYTWDYEENVDELVTGVDTVDICFKSCKDDTDCVGYTWSNSGIVQICYKFKHQLQGYQECVGCLSGVPQWNATAEIVDVRSAESWQECKQICSETYGCLSCSWYGNMTSFINTCFLSGDCQNNQGCDGRITEPSQCVDYMVLDEANRSVSNYNNGCVDDNNTWVCHSDMSEASNASSDWQGPGYYRVMSSAGLRLSESAPGIFHCQTFRGGWLQGEHHQDIYSEKKMTVCFPNYDDDCDYKANITVTNCYGYYVYMLPETPHFISMRYCISN